MENNNFYMQNGLGLTLEEYNNMYKFLKYIFWDDIKSRIPIISGIERYQQEKLYASEEQRLNLLLDNIQEKIHILDREKIDRNFINTEEFARIVFAAFNKVREDYRQEKIKYYANILINISTLRFSKEFFKEGILERICNYTNEHIIALLKIYEHHLEKNDKSVDIENKDNLIPDISKDDWDICVNTLTSDGFLTQGYFGGYIITKYGIKCIELISDIKID